VEKQKIPYKEDEVQPDFLNPSEIDFIKRKIKEAGKTFKELSRGKVKFRSEKGNEG